MGNIKQIDSLVKNKKKIIVSRSLSGAVISGGVWLIALKICTRMLGIIRKIVLARFLSPADFGIVGIAVLAISLIDTFSQPGFGAALVQKKGEIKEYLNTAWVISALRAHIIFIILFLSAPLVANFFNTPQAKNVIRVLAIAVILSGLGNIAVINFQRNLDFQKQYIFDFSMVFANFLVSITIACIYRSIWALVFGGIAQALTRFLMSYKLDSFRPKLKLNYKKLKELFKFGKWILLTTILIFLITQGDDIFIGKFFGAPALGLYQLAYTISNLPTTEIAGIISRVTFPAYSKIQSNAERFSKAYLNVLQVTNFIAIPFTGWLFICSSELTTFLLSDEWLPIIPIMQILVWAGLVRAIKELTAPVLEAMGKPKAHTKWNLIGLIVIAISIYPFAVSFGIIGVPISILLSNIVTAMGVCYEANALIGFGAKKFLKTILVPAINFSFCWLLVIKVNDYLYLEGIYKLILFTFLGGMLYSIVSYITEKAINYNTFSILKDSIYAAAISKK